MILCFEMILCFAGRQLLENSNFFKNTDFGSPVTWHVTQERVPMGRPAKRTHARPCALFCAEAPPHLRQGPDGGCKRIASSEPSAQAAFTGESTIGVSWKSDKGRKTKWFLSPRATPALPRDRDVKCSGSVFRHFRAAGVDSPQLLTIIRGWVLPSPWPLRHHRLGGCFYCRCSSALSPPRFPFRPRTAWPCAALRVSSAERWCPGQGSV